MLLKGAFLLAIIEFMTKVMTGEGRGFEKSHSEDRSTQRRRNKGIVYGIPHEY